MNNVVVCCCTYIYCAQPDRHAVRRLPFMNWEWISFTSSRRACWLARMSSVYMSGSLGCDSLPSLLLLAAITFDPHPLKLHIYTHRHTLARFTGSDGALLEMKVLRSPISCYLAWSFHLEAFQSISGWYLEQTEWFNPHCTFYLQVFHLSLRAYRQSCCLELSHICVSSRIQTRTFINQHFMFNLCDISEIQFLSTIRSEVKIICNTTDRYSQVILMLTCDTCKMSPWVVSLLGFLEHVFKFRMPAHSLKSDFRNTAHWCWIKKPSLCEKALYVLEHSKKKEKRFYWEPKRVDMLKNLIWY